ncbi:MFS transporter [Rhodovibrio salinarum]|uniref:MFS transporter n=1 Tax=Rhodovibrio salinarum TaxID=1087 RepID=A0A934QLD7_9PROT|nr:MFS transporter [Rhodovibrio salinarum]MBK1698882.1 MFS transporter [Rhodovibrio salinarum]
MAVRSVPGAGDTTASAALRIWALLFGMAAMLAGNGLQSSLLGLRADVENFGGTVTGLMMSGYFVGFFAGSILTPKLIRRVGHVRTFAALASLASIAILIHSVLVLPSVWTVMRLVTGFSFAGLYVVAESWLNDSASNALRGSLLAVYMIVSYLGLGAGQVMLNVASPDGYALFILCSVVISFALIPILLTAAPQPDASAPSPLSVRALIRISPLGMFGCFATGIANGVILAMAAVYARRVGLDVGGVSGFMVAIVLGGAILQWPIGKLSDLVDRRKVILLTAVLSAVAPIGLHLAASGSLSAFLVAGAVTGGLALSLYPLFLAYTNDWLEPRQMIAASSTLVLAYGAGAIFGPSGVGWLMDRFGPLGFAAYLAAIHVAIALFTLYRMTRRAAPEAQEDYVIGPVQASPTGAYWAEALVEEESDQDSAEESSDRSRGTGR